MSQVAGSLVGSEPLIFAASSISGNTTLNSSNYLVLCNASGGGFTVTLPTAASRKNKVYIIKKTDSSDNLVTIQANGIELIDDSNTQVLSTQYASLTIQSNGTAWYVTAA